MRPVLVLVHRYVGLATALFLAVAGLTGSVLAFLHEIDEALNPAFYTAQGEGSVLGLDALVERARADHPAMDFLYIESAGEAGHPALAVGMPRIDPDTGAPMEIGDSWLYLDPVTGETVASRTWGECCFEAENLIPFLYELHHTLALPETWGLALMGGVAVLWTLDCLVALVLTFPVGRPFFRKWKTAWTIKRNSGSYRTALDLHRAGGLWLWLVLLPVAVSSIAMNLPDQVFTPMVSLVSPVERSVYYQRGEMAPEERGEPRLDYGAILARGREEAARHAIAEPIHGVYFNRALNYYAVGYGDEHENPLGSPWLYFEGTEGRLLRATIPGEGTAGEVFVQLQGPIHGGQIGGLAGRIVIAVAGLVVFGLSVTGMVVWWMKRGARRVRAERAAKGATTGPLVQRSDTA